MRLLIIDDEEALAYALKKTLGKHGNIADIAGTILEGRDAAATNAYDCLLVDAMLPDGDGIDLIREIRECGCATPAIIMTAGNDVPRRIAGLNAGADDYLGKPVDMNELIARIHSVVRRTRGYLDGEVLEHGNLKLHENSRTLVTPNGRTLELSGKEFSLLEFLFRNPTQVLTREQLSVHLWGINAEVDDRALDDYVYFVRKKAVKLGVKNIILTVRGQGYRLNPAARG